MGGMAEDPAPRSDPGPSVPRDTRSRAAAPPGDAPRPTELRRGPVDTSATVLREMRSWPARRWATAVAMAALTVLVIGIPTDLIDTPLFSREIPPTWWSWPALIATGVLTGMLVATYVRSPLVPVERDRAGRWGTTGSVLSFFAVGCPVCNKLVLLALGTSGAVQFFEPVQPLIALVSLALLVWALVTRVRRENSCAVTVSAA